MGRLELLHGRRQVINWGGGANKTEGPRSVPENF